MYEGSTRGRRRRRGVFISYARTDGEAFATDLRRRLEAESILVWQDRVGLEGGRDWWLQITEALDVVEFMALVITPGALQSDTVRREWHYARQEGVCVYPLRGSPEVEFATLPQWMRDRHFYDITQADEWNNFLGHLNTPCQIQRVPFMVDDLPQDFVARPVEYRALKTLLLDERRAQPVAITAALRGAGGFGKSTLARALCHDEEVQDFFDGGVLWVTLGERPGELTGHVEDLIETLCGHRPNFSELNAAATRLRELLANRKALVVIDDVWNRAHLTPFLESGGRSARLITTRVLDTLPPGTDGVPVDAMTADEAVELLGAGLPGGREADLGLLAARLGEWPLLLKLVNAALRRRVVGLNQSLLDALRYVNEALNQHGLTAFDARDPQSREQAISKSLQVSFDLMTSQERARFSELAVFPEDVDVPFATVARLWGLSEFEAEALCESLYSMSLLLDFDVINRRIRLHDVLRKYLLEEKGQAVRAVHKRLLDLHEPSRHPISALPQPLWHRVAKTVAITVARLVVKLLGFSLGSRRKRLKGSSSWADLPQDEPYLWDHLAYHLIEAQRLRCSREVTQ
jgi:predicted ATPase